VNFQKLYHSVQSIQTRFLPYDAIQPLRRDDSAFRSAHRLLLGILLVFICAGVLLIALGVIDNKPTTASTGLVSAHRAATLDWAGWITEGIWWRNKQTPTPLPFTIHGLFFSLFGYSVRGILVLHTLVGALAAWLLFRITARRFGLAAGLLATSLCLAMPLFLYVTFAGWTFVWATMFLLLAVDLCDRAVLGNRMRIFLFAGVALGCAGMSRPENYAVSILFVAMSPFALRYRFAFMLLAFAYPLTQFVFNNVFWGDAPGLRILDDARSDMGYVALFREWFGSVDRNILNQNYSTALQWAILPAALCFGVPRHRLLTGVFAYFWVAFFAAYAMRRISFNHEGYYYAHVVLSTPFLAAVGVWIAASVANWAGRARLQRRTAAACAILLVLCLLAADRAALRSAYAERLFYRVPEPVQELRDALTERLGPDDPLVLDYFAEVSWMLAELEGDRGRNIFYYNTNTTGAPRPRLNAARKDIRDEELVAMNEWVYDNYARWQSQIEHCRYYAMLSEDAWKRETTRTNAMGHYRMFGLRAAYHAGNGTAWSGTPELTPPDSGIVFANSEFYFLDLDQTSPGPTILTAAFTDWPGAPLEPKGWTVRPPSSDAVTPVQLKDGPAAMLHPQPDGFAQLILNKRSGFDAIQPGATIYLEGHMKSEEDGAIIVLLGFERTNGESYNVKLETTDIPAQWKYPGRVITLPKDIIPGKMYVAVNLRPVATLPATIAEVTVRSVYIP